MLNFSKTYNIAGVSAPAVLFLLFFIINLAASILIIEYSYYIPLSIIGLSILLYSFSNILLGICIIIFFHAVILMQTPEISPAEIIFFTYYFFLFLSWFLKRIIVQRKRLIEEKSDYFLVTFIALAFLSLIPALINRVDVTQWFRELIPFLTFLIYFMVKTEVKTKKHTLIIILSLFAVSLFFSINNIMKFRLMLSNIQYFWEIATSRQVLSEIFFAMSLILGFSFLFSSIPKKLKPILITFIMITGVSLAITFSRGYWIAFILGITVLFFLGNKSEKINFLIYISFFIIILFAFASIYIENLFEFIGISLLKRFPTFKDLFTDVSFINRINEAKGIFQSTKYYFVAGAGLGARFNYFDIIKYETVDAWYSHNAFLYLLFKLGLPGLITFFLFYFSIIRYSLAITKIKLDNFVHALIKGIVSLLISLFFLSVSSPQFYQKDSVLIFAILSGLVFNYYKNFVSKEDHVTFNS